MKERCERGVGGERNEDGNRDKDRDVMDKGRDKDCSSRVTVIFLCVFRCSSLYYYTSQKKKKNCKPRPTLDNTRKKNFKKFLEKK